MTNSLHLLRQTEFFIAQRKINIQRFGAGWIRPPGVGKTYQASMDEAAEREEHARLLERADEEEAAMNAAGVTVDMEGDTGVGPDAGDDITTATAAATTTPAANDNRAVNNNNNNNLQERNLDDDIPEAAIMDDDNDDDYEDITDDDDDGLLAPLESDEDPPVFDSGFYDLTDEELDDQFHRGQRHGSDQGHRQG